jgi:hypothetical protein
MSEGISIFAGSDLKRFHGPRRFNLDLYLQKKTVLSNYCAKSLELDKNNALPRKIESQRKY